MKHISHSFFFVGSGAFRRSRDRDGAFRYSRRDLRLRRRGAYGIHRASGPMDVKGCVARLHPTGKTTHYDLCVAGAPANHVRCASLRSGGRRLAVRTAMEHPIGALPRTPFPASRDFPSRGNERYEEKSESYTSGTISAFSPFGGWRHHLSPASGGTMDA